MKAGYGCQLFGAQQVLTGIKDCVVLLHSVVGCNYSTMALHFTACDMSEVNQTCTVISDSEVVFGGEGAVLEALHLVKEQYDPRAVFVITGCVSDMIQDDIASVCRQFEEETGLRTIAVDAAGYRGSFEDGYEKALAMLADVMDAGYGCREVGQKAGAADGGAGQTAGCAADGARDGGAKDGIGSSGTSPEAGGKCVGVHSSVHERQCYVVNILGLGADEFRLRQDKKALQELLGEDIKLGAVFGDCTLEEVENASHADLNMVIGRGIKLAEIMKERFGIPYELIDYPYGLTGAQELWSALSRHFKSDYSEREEHLRRFTGDECRRYYGYIQALYGIPVAVIGTRARARGMRRFLSEELGMEVEVMALREENRDIQDFYDEVKNSEAALIFGSSFEQDLADEHECPLVRFDYPVIDRFTLSYRPYIGEMGTLCLIEDILSEVVHGRKLKGALYQ